MIILTTTAAVIIRGISVEAMSTTAIRTSIERSTAVDASIGTGDASPAMSEVPAARGGLADVGNAPELASHHHFDCDSGAARLLSAAIRGIAKGAA
jgi:hypothetical protein